MKINWWGNIDSFSGYGSQGLGIVLELARRGHDVRIWKPGLDILLHDTPPALAPLLERPWHDVDEADACLMHGVVEGFENVMAPDWERCGRRLYAWTMFEWAHLPGDHERKRCMEFTHWKDKLHAVADAIIVPASEQVNIFRRSGVQLPIHVVQDGLDADTFPYTPAPTTDGEFRVFSWGYLNSRKCPLETVQTFWTAFPKHEFPQARLHIKTVDKQFGMGRFPMPRFDDERVSVTSALWSRQRLVEEIQRSHVCLLLSHGEGSGNMPVQATAVGRPVVASSHSGLSDFMRPAWSYPVKTKQMDLYPPPAFTEGVRYWRWTSDYDHAASQLRRVERGYDVALAKAQYGAGVVRSQWSHAAQIDALEGVFRREGLL